VDIVWLPDRPRLRSRLPSGAQPDALPSTPVPKEVTPPLAEHEFVGAGAGLHAETSKSWIRIAAGQGAGGRTLTLKNPALVRTDSTPKPFTANRDGFSLNCAVSCQTQQRDRLERLCRYITRPALCLERLSTVVSFIDSGFFADWEMSYVRPTNDMCRLGMAIGYVGLVMLICKSGILTLLRSSLAAVGQMALTNYLSQSVICNFIFMGYGLGLVGQLQRFGPHRTGDRFDPVRRPYGRPIPASSVRGSEATFDA